MAEARGGADPIGVLARGAMQAKGGGGPGVYVEHQFAVTEVPLQDGKCLCQNGDPIQSETVVEFAYLPSEKGEGGGVWVPLRVRHDKTALYRTTRSIAGAANDYHIARSVMASILDPVTMGMLLGTERVGGGGGPQAQGSGASAAASEAGVPLYYNRDTSRGNLATLPMLDFHNHWVKNHSLISHLRAAGAKKVLDVACGKGGDLFKYVNTGCRVVVGVDIAPDNLLNPDDGAYARLAEMRTRQKDGAASAGVTAVFLQMDCSNPLEAEYNTATGQLRDINGAALGFVQETRVPRSLAPFYRIATGGFDAACCMFGVHYFFAGPQDLDTLGATLRSRVERGGLLLLTFMDGEQVDRLFERAGSMTVRGQKDGKTIWSIGKHYDALSEDPLQNYGKSIDVYVESINQTVPEYLVDPRLLTKVLEAHEFEPLPKAAAKKLGFPGDTGLFGDLIEAMASSPAAARGAEKVAGALSMSADEKRFSFLNRMGVQAIETELDDYSNWVVMWSTVYLVVLTVLYSFIYDWVRRMERSCPCSAGWERDFIRVFPLASLVFNLVMVLFVNMVLVSGSTVVRTVATILNFLSVGSFVGWAVYAWALYRFVQKARSGGCICATEPRVFHIAVWTLVGQGCHMLVSILFGVLIILFMNDVRRQYVVNVLKSMVPGNKAGSSRRIRHYQRD
ncbi:hypothetical protein HXX76_016014 [Chlamydomonas incerta]|uniref:mRNA (guanine-N(7))-methyltransferase n=1 Tax=Chlamydomonas incerta TaxID=51695 RepID=A0A835VR42_CHLIN|nr:hypothetical protein HXX76_016014 [Chlamydomonas incerta]|eukprot:KAG2422444.1 hypothetical protein HXX76_016014 [Chlamydomonas incerta]